MITINPSTYKAANGGADPKGKRVWKFRGDQETIETLDMPYEAAVRFADSHFRYQAIVVRGEEPNIELEVLVD
jgi:hypothetical protein